MIVAAAFWGVGNVVGKIAGNVDMLAFTVWSSLVAPLPLLVASAWFDGPAALAPLLHPSLTLALCVLALSYGGTVFGYRPLVAAAVALSRRRGDAVRAAGAGGRHVRRLADFCRAARRD